VPPIHSIALAVDTRTSSHPGGCCFSCFCPTPSPVAWHPLCLLQAHLALLVDADDRCRQLAANLGRLLKGSTVDAATMCEGLFPQWLGGYPAQELAWLAAAFEEQVRLILNPQTKNEMTPYPLLLSLP